jgi:hypothetical protein
MQFRSDTLSLRALKSSETRQVKREIPLTLIGGMPMSEPVVSIKIVEYHPRWPILYTEERARVVAQLGDMVESIEHIGSTSVPGLSAKPIIDILVTVARLGPADPYIERLGSLGYTFFPVLGNADRYAFGKGSPPHPPHPHRRARRGGTHPPPRLPRLLANTCGGHTAV